MAVRAKGDGLIEMGKRDEFWARVPRNEVGEIAWPDDQGQRAELARAIFGAKVIGALEAILEEHWDVADGNPPKPGQNDYLLEKSRRQVFASMSPEARSEVRRLVRQSCFGTLYWILVKLEHYPQGDVDFTVEPFMPDGKDFPKVGVEETELHHLYFQWVERFSEYGDE